MTLTRAAAVGAVAAALLLTLSLSSAVAHDAADATPEDRRDWSQLSLGELGKRSKLRVGTAVDMTAFANDTTYRERIATEFSSVTAENVMKWETIEPQRGVYNWAPADELVAFARANNQVVRGHTLLWHNQLPGWLTSGVADGSIPPDELRQILRNHVFTVLDHFRGKVYQWDVVNEVIDDNANLRDTMWLQQLGPGYIADMFRWASQADRHVKLYLNDYNVEGLSAKSQAYVDLATQLLAGGVPVHGMGIQGHLGVQFGFWPASAVAANMTRFADLGLDLAITEADVRMPMPTDVFKLQGQAQGYSTLMSGCLLTKRCNSFTVWGYTDKYSWVPGFFTGQGAANLLDENFNAKPAYESVRADLALGRR